MNQAEERWALSEKDNSGHAMTWAPVCLQSPEKDGGYFGQTKWWVMINELPELQVELIEVYAAPHFPFAFALPSTRKVHDQAGSGVLVYGPSSA